MNINFYKRFKIHFYKYSFRFFSNILRKCIRCDYSVIFVCNKCHLPIDNITSISAYKLFNLPKTYFINKNTLRSSYLLYQNLLHPDKHYGVEKETLELITNSSSYVSTAYKLLLDHKKRGIELLSELDQDATLPECDIEYIFELHEAVDSIRTGAEAKTLKSEIDNKIENIIKEIDTSFIEKKYDIVRSSLSTLGYLDAISKRLGSFSENSIN